MAVGIKTTELPVADSVASTTSLIGVVGGITSQIPLAKTPVLLGEILFYRANDVVEVTQADHYRRFLNLNNTDGPITINLPDITTIWEDEDAINRGGLFCYGVVTSGENDVIITGTTSGQMRTSAPNFQAPLENDTVYVGSRKSLGDEAIFSIYKRGSFWVIESMAGFRESSDAIEGLIKASDLEIEVDITSGQDRELTDADHKRPVWLTNTTPGTLTFQEDIAEGIEITVINDGSSAAVFDPGDHTILGDTAVSSGQAATIIVGPVVSGNDRKIFIASAA